MQKIDDKKIPKEGVTAKKPSLKKNALSNWAALAVDLVVGIFLTPYIIRELGNTGYGIWTLVGSFVGYYGLLNFGVGSAIGRYIARYTAQRNEKALNEVASTAMLMFCITGLIAMTASFVFAGIAADFFEVESQSRQVFIRLIWVIGITTAIGFPTSVLTAIVTAREHFVAANTITIFRALLRAGLVVLFVQMGWGLLGVGFAPMVATMVALLGSVCLYRIYTPDVRISISHANKRTLKMLLVFGGITTVSLVADILRYNLDSFVIGKYINLDAIAFYGVAALLIRYISNFVNALKTVLLPRFSGFDGLGEHDKIEQLFLRSLKIAAFWSFGLYMFAICFGPRFILFWAGEPYAKSIPILIVLAVGYSFGSAQMPVAPLMYAMHKHSILAILTIIEGILNLILSLLLVNEYGIIGVAMGTTIPYILMHAIVRPLIVCKSFRISGTRYTKELFLPCVFCCLVTAIFFYADLAEWMRNVSIYLYFPIVVVSAALYFGLGSWTYLGMNLTNLRKVT